MTYATALDEMLLKLPELRSSKHFDPYYFEDNLPYVAFGSVLIPALEDTLRAEDSSTTRRICEYIEEAAVSSQKDTMLESLIQIEVGEWLGGTCLEAQIAPWLGEQTKRVCGYVPGLATQRLAIREEQKRHRISRRIASWWRKIMDSQR